MPQFLYRRAYSYWEKSLVAESKRQVQIHYLKTSINFTQVNTIFYQSVNLKQSETE